MRSGDDRDVASGLFTLARVREALGRLTEAEPLYETGHGHERATIATRQPESADQPKPTRLVYYHLGKIEKATALYEKVLKRQLATLGRRHPQTLMTSATSARITGRGTIRGGHSTPGRGPAGRKQHPELGFVGPNLLDPL